MGFLGTYKAPWTDASKRYVAFKEKVRLLANCAGVPDELTPNQRAEIIVSIHWKKRARCDSPNLYKSVEDSIFKKDRRVLMGSFMALENTGEEKCFVKVFVL